jgi:hypothetical protein
MFVCRINKRPRLEFELHEVKKRPNLQSDALKQFQKGLCLNCLSNFLMIDLKFGLCSGGLNFESFVTPACSERDLDVCQRGDLPETFVTEYEANGASSKLNCGESEKLENARLMYLDLSRSSAPREIQR